MSADAPKLLNVNDINLFDTAVLVDPWEAYQRLRDESPVHFLAAGNMHVVTRYDLVLQVLRDTEIYSSQYGPFIDATRQHWLESAAAPVREQFL